MGFINQQTKILEGFPGQQLPIQSSEIPVQVGLNALDATLDVIASSGRAERVDRL